MKIEKVFMDKTANMDLFLNKVRAQIPKEHAEADEEAILVENKAIELYNIIHDKNHEFARDSTECKMYLLDVSKHHNKTTLATKNSCCV